MLLAEKLLEGYGEFYTSVEESDIVDPIAYLNEVCIEAITALQEAAQQYYIGDIIGQSEVLMEGCTEEALMESIGSKAKELWGKFVKKVKEIIKWFKEKITKIVSIISEKIKKTIEVISKPKDILTDRVFKAPEKFADVVNEMNKIYPQIEHEMSIIRDNVPNEIAELTDFEQLLSKVIKANIEHREIQPVKSITFNIGGKEMSSTDIVDKIHDLTNELSSNTSKQYNFNDMTKITNTLTTLRMRMISSTSKLNNIINVVNSTLPKVLPSESVDAVRNITYEQIRKNKPNFSDEMADNIIMHIINQMTTSISNCSAKISCLCQIENASTNFLGKAIPIVNKAAKI